MSASALLVGWRLNPETEWSLAPGEGRGGGSALRLRHAVAEARGPVGLSQTIDPHRFIGKRLRISACVRGEGGESSWYLFANRHGRIGEAFGAGGEERHVGTEWTEGVLALDVTPGTLSVDWGVSAGRSDLLVCDFRVDVEHSETAATDRWRPRPPLPPAPRALDFATLDGWHVPLAGGWLDGTGDGPGVFRLRSASGEGWLDGIEQSIDAAAYRGRRMRLAGQLRAEALSRRAGLFFTVDGERHFGLAFDGPPYSGVTGTTEWTDSAVVLDVPSEARCVRIGAKMAGTGTVWVRALRFDEVGEETPVTDVLARLGTAPRDLDFPGAPGAAPVPPWILASKPADAEVDGEGGVRIFSRGAWMVKLTQELSASALRGQRVRFSGRLTPVGKRPLGRLCIVVEGADRTYAAAYDRERLLFGPYGSGVTFETAAVAAVPVDAARIVIELELFGRELHARDLRFEVVDESVAVNDDSDLGHGPVDLALEGPAATNVSSGWQVVGLSASVSRDDAGVTTLRGGPAAPGPIGLLQRFRAEPYRLQRIRLRARARTRGVQGAGARGGGVMMAVTGRDPNRPFGSGPTDDPLQLGGTEWTEQVVVLDVARDAHAITIGVILFGPGELAVRDLSFEIVNESVPLTDFMGVRLLAPRNLSFEESRPGALTLAPTGR